jgi:2-dehydro-3-deoxyphosphooctonate aldolase (KDO 8-P synthase)
MLLDKNKLIIMCGPNVIESKEHCFFMASELKKIFDKFNNIQFIFKVSIDKANRSSISSYRGVSFEEGISILNEIKLKLNIPIITDVHESWQCEPISKIVDIIQIPAFLCRQTDLIKSASETNKIIHVKKGQFLNSDTMHKVVEKIRYFGHTNEIILCERGNMFGYNDLVVDFRNLQWMKSNDNLISMDITHCLQQPSQKIDGIIKSGGLREFVPLMGKLALISGVNALFIEVHNDPEKAKCDGPTQFYLNKLEDLLFEFNKYYLFSK